MDILNKKERFSAFTLFFLMFAITTGVLIAALFFNYRLPLKENEVLRTENAKITKEANFNKIFSEKIERVVKLVDSLDKSPENFDYLAQTISSDLSKLQNKADSLGSDSKLYGNVIFSINKLVNTKKTMSQLSTSNNDTEKLAEKNQELMDKNRSLEFDLKLCKAQNN